MKKVILMNGAIATEAKYCSAGDPQKSIFDPHEKGTQKYYFTDTAFCFAVPTGPLPDLFCDGLYGRLIDRAIIYADFQLGL